MADYYLRRGDTAPAITATLKDAAAAVLDLTTATGVVMKLRRGTQVISKTTAILTPLTAGQVKYQWIAGDWSGASALVVGFYDLEFEVTYTGGTVLTIPTVGFLQLEVVDDIQ